MDEKRSHGSPTIILREELSTNKVVATIGFAFRIVQAIRIVHFASFKSS